MAILPYQYVASYASHHDFLEGFKDFAIARGWTVDSYLRDTQWVSLGGGSYGFVAGDESYLKLHSAGFGSQQLNYKIRLENTGTYDDVESLKAHGFVDANFPDDDTYVTHPADYGFWDYGNYNSLHPTNIGPVWFFGNSYFLMAVIRCFGELDDSSANIPIDESYFVPICVGSIELFDITTTEGMLCHFSIAHSTYDWNRGVGRVPFDNSAQQKYFYHFGNPVTSMLVDCRDPRYGYQIAPEYSRILVDNPAKPDRFIYQPTVHLLNPSAEWVPLGRSPLYRVNTFGLEPGEILLRDSSEFMCFPNGIRGYNGGMAVRIA